MQPNIFPILRGDSAVRALIGTRVYPHGEAPQKVVAPYVTWFVLSGNPENYLSDPTTVDAISVQVDCWSDNTGTGSTGVKTLQKAVRKALEKYHYCTGLNFDGRDFETQRYRMSMTFDFWQAREDEDIATDEDVILLSNDDGRLLLSGDQQDSDVDGFIVTL